MMRSGSKNPNASSSVSSTKPTFGRRAPLSQNDTLAQHQAIEPTGIACVELNVFGPPDGLLRRGRGKSQVLGHTSMGEHWD
jgi:hypothetical protein